MGDGEVIEGVLSGGERLDKALALASGLSRERIKALIAEGRIALNGKTLAQPSAKAAEGARFRIEVPAAASAEAAAQEIPLAIAYEDEHLVVVDKPAGMVVHPAAGNLEGTLVNALLYHCRGQLSGIGGVASTRTPRACGSWPRATRRTRGWRASSPRTTSSGPISRSATAIPDRLRAPSRAGSGVPTPIARKWRCCPRIPRAENMR